MPRGRLYAICLLLALPLALLSTEIRQYSRNTLDENGRWVSAKTLMQIGLVGAHHFMRTRNALAGNRLDLGAWHGYNEIYFSTPLTLGTVDLSFRLDQRAHLSILFFRDESSFAGIRFSRHPDLPSMLFRGERSGRFTWTRPIPDPGLDDRWRDVSVVATTEGWTVALDGTEVARLPTDTIPDGYVGLRNGSYRAEVDDIVIQDAAGALVLDESFRHPRGYWSAFLASFVIAGLALCLVGWLASRGRDEEDGQPLFWVVLIALLVTFAAGVYLVFDRQVWSKSYFYRRHVPTASQGPATATLVRLESWRQRLFGVDSEVMIEPTVDRLTRSLSAWDFAQTFAWPGPHDYHRYAAYRSTAPGQPRYFSPDRLQALGPGEDSVRIAFSGSSQVVGAGAELAADSFVARLHRLLSQQLADSLVDTGRELEIVNVAVQSSQVPLQLLTFERRWADLEPDLLLINLSYNDLNLHLFEQGLKRFAQLGEQMGHQTIFIVEAMAPDHDNAFVREKQHAMRRLGRETGVPVLDLEAYMADEAVRDSGFLWWDPVHMSSYAQHVAAEWLAGELEPWVRRELEADESPAPAR